MKLELERPILIHICKDRTLSYRSRDEKIFNGVAFPVFSVEDREEAEDLILAVGRKQYHEHPLMPGRDWYKITLDGQLDFKPYLDVEDVEAVANKLASVYNRLKNAAVT